MEKQHTPESLRAMALDLLLSFDAPKIKTQAYYDIGSVVALNFGMMAENIPVIVRGANIEEDNNGDHVTYTVGVPVLKKDGWHEIKISNVPIGCLLPEDIQYNS